MGEGIPRSVVNVGNEITNEQYGIEQYGSSMSFGIVSNKLEYLGVSPGN